MLIVVYVCLPYYTLSSLTVDTVSYLSLYSQNLSDCSIGVFYNIIFFYRIYIWISHVYLDIFVAV